MATTDWLDDLRRPTMVRAGGVTLAARSVGRGPRIVLLHGGPGLDHHYLLPLAVELGEGHEVLLPDLPGHGMSAHLDRMMPGLRSFRTATLDWLGGLEPAPAALAGHSLGAWLVMESLRKAIVRPDSAVLLSPASSYRSPRPPTSGRTEPNAPEVPTTATAHALRRELLSWIRADSTGEPSPQLIAAIHGSRLRPRSDHGTLRSELQRALARPPAMPVRRVPVLILVGAHDPARPADDEARALASRSELHVRPDDGHFVGAADPRAVARQVAEFVNKHAKGPSNSRPHASRAKRSKAK